MAEPERAEPRQPPGEPLADAESFEAFLAIVARLRAPDGCPWDRAQSHASLSKYLLEETHEALEAIEESEWRQLAEELGDVLLQVGLHAQIGAEKGEFTIRDVLRSINAKLVRRHPHVFGDVKLSTPAEVEANWQRLKSAERKEQAEGSLLDGVPKGLPALAQSQDLQSRAARAGFDWPDMRGVLDKVREELDEFEKARSQEELTHELGDIFAALVNIGRKLGIDGEQALRLANARFRRRFQHMEGSARSRGLSISNLPLDQQEALWQAAKRDERKAPGDPSAERHA